MSLALLHETRTELRRLAIAGGSLAADDFRLKKLIPQLAEAGKTAPVFARLGSLLERVMTSDASALLEAGVLVNAILYTQAASGCAGESISSQENGALPATTQGYRMLNPLRIALSTKGGGRQEIIEQGIESGAIYDLRLLGAVIGALEDSYAAIPPLIAEVLKRIGPPCVPALLARFDPKEKGAASPLRLEILGHILQAEGFALYRTAYDEGTPALKIKAIELMGSNPEFEPLLIEAAKSRKQEMREAAFLGLSSLAASPEARNILLAALDSADYPKAIKAIVRKGNALLLQDLTDRAATLLEKVEGLLAASPAKIDPKEGGPLDRLFSVLGGIKTTPTKTPAMYELAVRVLMLTLRHPKVQLVEQLDSFHGNYNDDLREEMRSCLSMAAKAVASFGMRDALAVLEDSLGENDSSKSLVFTTARLALDLRTPEQFFDFYHRLMEDGVKTPRGEALMNLLCRFMDSDVFATLDPRWSTLFIRHNQLRLVIALASPGQADTEKYLREKMEATLRLAKENKSVYSHELINTLGQCVSGLVRMGVEDFAPDFCRWVEENYLLDFLLGPSQNRSRYNIPYQRYVAEALSFIPEIARPMLERVLLIVQEKKPAEARLVESLIADFYRAR